MDEKEPVYLAFIMFYKLEFIAAAAILVSSTIGEIVRSVVHVSD